MRTELTSRLAAVDPARNLDEHLPDGVWHQMAQDIVASASGADAPDHVRARSRVPSRQSRRVVAVLLAASALVAAPLGFTLTGRSSGASVAAAGVLDKAAITAVDPAATGGQYWRITTTGGSPSTRFETRAGAEVSSTWWVSDTTTSFVAVDGSRPTFTERWTGATQRQLTGGPGWAPLPKDFSIDTMNLSPNDLPGGWQTPNRRFLAALPRDVRQLRERLYADAEGHGTSVDGEVVVLVADVLRSGLVPADLRASLFHVLKTVPDVEVTDQAVTMQGRTGVGIARTELVDGARQELIVDPANGLLIGERTVIVNGSADLPPGTVLAETSVRTTIVDSVPAHIRSAAHHSTCVVDADNGITCTH